jgi:hypothetical protein
MAGGKTIGKSLNFGFAGSFARTPDMIITTRPNTSGSPILLGTVLVYDATGGVIPADSTFTVEKFVGIAGRETKTMLNYLDQNSGAEYPPDDAVSVFQRGSISVICAVGTPIVGGAVYVRTVADTGKAIGDLEATADSTNNVLLTNAQWGGGKDANGVCELVLLTRNNA